MNISMYTHNRDLYFKINSKLSEFDLYEIDYYGLTYWKYALLKRFDHEKI